MYILHLAQTKAGRVELKKIGEGLTDGNDVIIFGLAVNVGLTVFSAASDLLSFGSALQLTVQVGGSWRIIAGGRNIML